MVYSLWLQKSILLLLYEQMFSALTWPNRIMKAYWVTLAATYIPIMVVIFTECGPTRLFWQITPDPGIQFHRLSSISVHIADSTRLMRSRTCSAIPYELPECFHGRVAPNLPNAAAGPHEATFSTVCDTNSIPTPSQRQKETDGRTWG